MARTSTNKSASKPGFKVVQIRLRTLDFELLAQIGDENFRKASKQGQAFILAGLRDARRVQETQQA